MELNILHVVFACMLLSGCALRAQQPVRAAAPSTLGLPLTVSGDVQICIQETPTRWSCLTMGELRQVIATLKRL